jgi:cyclic-di-AMP phosphodiesterase PgpH
MAFIRFPARAGHSKKESERKRSVHDSQTGARLALGLATVLILSFLFSMHLLPDKVNWHVGDVSTEEIRAHRTVRYIDTVETERMRDEAASLAPKVYTPVPNATSGAIESVSNVFGVVRRARLDQSLVTSKQKLEFITHSLSTNFDTGVLTALLQLDQPTFDQAELCSKQLIGEIMDRELRDDADVRTQRMEFRRQFVKYLGSSRYAGTIARVGASLITPNRIFDLAATNNASEKARRAVPIQYRQIYIGDVVIEKGEKVTSEHMDKFVALGLSHPQVDYVSVLCISMLITCIVIFTIIYLARYHTAIYASMRFSLLLSLIVVVSVLGLKLGGSMLGIKLSGVQFGYFSMIWIATAGMLTAILLDPQLAILIVALLSATSGLAMNHDLRWPLAALVSSLVAIYAVSDIRHRSDVIRAGIAVSAANLAMVWLMGRISGDEMNDLMVGSVWAVAGGFGSVLLFWLGTASLEKPFGITTHLRLLELSDTNSPILKRLLMEAPGTYSHSIFVGNIAAAAAEVIGADELLVRVASYYHDVGKMRRPHFFVENQHVENAHDHLNPSLSALVIRSHTKDGLELAREYKLPPLIRELMGQHHGTSLVKYFYYQVGGDNGNGSAALEQQFRYDETKPQSREAAILMLADAVEAASRTLSKPTLGRIESMVDEIIADKLTDGQLDESDLTFKDISRIKESFVRTLTSMLHARIEYPDAPVEAKKPVANGSAGKELPAGTAG